MCRGGAEELQRKLWFLALTASRRSGVFRAERGESCDAVRAAQAATIFDKWV